MKAIILAAGSGTRMKKYTENLPKGMLVFEGKTLIERQIEVLRNAGVYEIAVVTGYKHEKICYDGVSYFHNEEFATTNMIESLMSAEEFFNGEILVAYSDILYTEELVNKCIKSPCDIGVAVDSDWKKLWQIRYGTTETDLESLSVSEKGMITEIGKPVYSSTGLDYRYIGLLKFSDHGTKIVKDVYEKMKKSDSVWKQSGKSFKLGYMTDLLAETIDQGFSVNSIPVKGNWLEFDTNTDYEVISKAKADNILNDRYEIEK